jgi:hypothetical protein
MAVLKNDRNELLFSASSRVTGAVANVTSGVVSSLIVPKNTSAPVPASISLTANVSGYIAPAYAWKYKFSNDVGYTNLAATTSTINVTTDSAYLTLAGTNTGVEYVVTVSETTANMGVNQTTAAKFFPILREGADGFNSASLVLYKRTVTNSAPAVTTAGNSTYTFSSGTLVGQPTDWTTSIPSAASGAYLWVIRVTAAATTNSYVFANTLWSSPTLFSQDGINGTSGSNIVRVFAYKRAAVAPTDNPGDIVYNFTTNTITTTPLANSWTPSIPAGADPLYVVLATAASTTSTDNIAAAEWSSPVVLASNGAAGATGINSATVFLYARNTSNSVAPAVATTGSAIYTFSNGVLSGTIPAGWTQALPALGANTVLWVIRATAASNTTTDSIANTEWSTAAVLAEKGATGTTGTRGSRDIYLSGAEYTAGYVYNANAAGAASYAVKATDTIASVTSGSVPTTPITGDTVTFTNGSNYVYTITYNTGTTTWNPPGTVIDGSLLVTGSVTTTKIAANSISAEKLVVSSKGGLTILSDDPYFTDPTYWTKAVNIGYNSASIAGLTGSVAPTYVSCSAGVNQQIYSTRTYPISSTKTYYLSAALYAAAGNDRNCYIFIEFYDASGTYIASTGWGGSKSGYTYGGLPVTGSWTRYGGNFGSGISARLIPATAKQCRIGVWFQHSTGTSAVEVAAQDLRLDEAINAGQLIVDGTITATQIDSRGLTIRDAAGIPILTAGASVAASTLNLGVTTTNVPAGWQNSNVSITSAGVLSGAGGGTVTAAGISAVQTSLANAPAGILNNQITVASGALQGIGTGAGTVVANNQITVTSGALQGIGTGAGTVVANNQIAVNVSGQLTGIGTGVNTTVANSQIAVNGSGQLTGIGTGVNTTVANSQITVASGALQGIGTGAGTIIDNSYQTIGQNLIPNSDQSQRACFVSGFNPNSAVFANINTFASATWPVTNYTLSGITTRNIYIRQTSFVAGGNTAVAIDNYPTGGWGRVFGITVVPGQKYIWSCYLQSHRCQYFIGLQFWNAAGTATGSEIQSATFSPSGANTNRLDLYNRPFIIATAPSDAVCVTMYVRKLNTMDSLSDSYIWYAAPQLEAVSTNAQGPSPYVGGPPASVTQLNGLSSAAQNVMAGAGALTAGSLVLNTSGARVSGSGIALSAGGFVGYDTSGNSTFVVGSATGDAYFKGAVFATSGNFAGSVNTGAYTGYAWPAVGNYGSHLSSSGLLIGNYNNNTYFEVNNVGNVYAPGFSIVGGTATFSGNLSGAEGNFSGTVNAGQINLTQLVGDTFTYTTNINKQNPNSNYTAIRVTAVGGGGGGGASTTAWGGKGGGGGGGKVIATFTSGITASTIAYITIGAGGNAGVAGGNTAVTINGTTIYANGGGAGGNGSTTTGGPGGTAGTFSGGSGENGLAGAPGGTGAAPYDVYSGGKESVYLYTVAGVTGSAGSGGVSKMPPNGNGGSGGNAGQVGKVIIEFYNPNGVIQRNEFSTLKTELMTQISGLTLS